MWSWYYFYKGNDLKVMIWKVMIEVIRLFIKLIKKKNFKLKLILFFFICFLLLCNFLVFMNFLDWMKINCYYKCCLLFFECMLR